MVSKVIYTTLITDYYYDYFTSVLDPDPHGSRTFAWIRIRNYSSGSGSSLKWKSIHVKLWILDYFYYWTVVLNREGQIVVKIIIFDECKVFFCIISKYT